MMDLSKLYDELLDDFGPQDWWPAESSFEMMIGAILTQNVSWKNVETAIACLRSENILDPESILETDDKSLEQMIRPSGFYKQKTQRIKRLAAAVLDVGDVESFLERDDLRERLLDINGIGPETADSIVLYAAHMPHFVVDAYTMRILKRIYAVEGDYEYIKKQFHLSLEEDVELYQEFHALLVNLGKNYCKVKPVCEECPVSNYCLHFNRR